MNWKLQVVPVAAFIGDSSNHDSMMTPASTWTDLSQSSLFVNPDRNLSTLGKGLVWVAPAPPFLFPPTHPGIGAGLCSGRKTWDVKALCNLERTNWWKLGTRWQSLREDPGPTVEAMDHRIRTVCVKTSCSFSPINYIAIQHTTSDHWGVPSDAQQGVFPSPKAGEEPLESPT